MTRFMAASAAAVMALLATKPVAQGLAEPSPAAARLTQVASFEHQVTGVTVSKEGRIFVNFPR